MLIYLVIVLAIASRFIPHLPNVGVITALAVFSATFLSKKQALAIPLAVRFISDAILGFFSWPLMIAVYLSHLSGVVFGLWIKKSKQGTRWLKIISSGLGTSLIFFLVTNFAWFYPEYPHNFAGLIQSYVNGLPFLRGTMIGDVGYVVGLFSVYELVYYLATRKKLALIKA
jgi:hypothetical protein